MKLKEWLLTFLAGMGIGVGSAVPGVSGGTIAIILKVYEKILWAVSNILKQFKKAFFYLLPLLLGVIAAVIPMIILMDEALNAFLFGTVCIFAGFIIGSFPGIKDEVKGEPIKKSYVIALIISALIAVGLGVASVLSKADVSSIFIDKPIWLYFVLIPIGVIASTALVVPGLSGSMILLLIGFYQPLIGSTRAVMHEVRLGVWDNVGSQLGVLVSFGIGVVIGFYLVSKLMHFLLAKYRLITFYAIIGFIIGSTIALFFNYSIYSYYVSWSIGGQGYLPYYIEVPIGVVLLIIACILSYLLVIYKRKAEQNKTSEEIQ